MIEKERLKELIKKEATVYMARYYSEGIHLEPNNFEVNDKELVFKYKIYVVPLEDLFETREEAQWFYEFGKIERIERLEIPSWKEVNKIIEEKKWFHLEFKTKFEEISFEVDEASISVNHHNKDYMSGSERDFNMANYIIACKELKNLFLGRE